jgi:hypothetical protein
MDLDGKANQLRQEHIAQAAAAAESAQAIEAEERVRQNQVVALLRQVPSACERWGVPARPVYLLRRKEKQRFLDPTRTRVINRGHQISQGWYIGCVFNQEISERYTIQDFLIVTTAGSGLTAFADQTGPAKVDGFDHQILWVRDEEPLVPRSTAQELEEHIARFLSAGQPPG